MKPSWSTNILEAKIVWENMGTLQNPKEAVLVGTIVNAKKNVENKANNKNLR